MQRRKFLQRAALLPIPVLLSRFKLSALTTPMLASAVNPESDRVLVLLQLNGGNDGLNTLVPLDQYANLTAVRGNLVLPEANLLPIETANALHPVMTGIRDLYDAGKVSIIQGVGYANQNRSHFRSTDIWNTGSSAETVITTGWLGRHLDVRFPDYPAAFPTTEQPDPFAIVMGTAVSETCQGMTGNFSIAINDVENVGQLPTFAGTPDTTTPYGQELDWLKTTIEQSNEYAGGIQDAVAMGNTVATYPEDNEVAAKLRDVARLISGGLGTKVYVVELGGFDTHANQAPEGSSGTGIHADLLRTISDAVAAFQDDLSQLGLEDRVLGMTYSEFGRRIRSNVSQGTDHGDAAPLFLFGGCVSGGIIGDNPEIDTAVSINEGVAMQYDFRNVYGSVLMDWFGVEQTTVNQLLTDDFAYIPVLSNCSTTSTDDRPNTVRTVDLSVAPNPFGGGFQATFVTGNERARVVLFDALGRQALVVADRQFAAGEHRLTIDGQGLPAGPYYLHLTLAGGARVTKRVIKK